MDHKYASRKRTNSASPDKKTMPQGPSFDALRSGAAQPTAEQMGHRVDLPDAMRAKMEDAFGADLSAVKLYESQSVADAGAKAMTQGANIAFAPGMLDFTSFGGQALLGHELSHVVSQARGEVTGGGFLNDHALEARADREGAMAAAGQTVAMPTAALATVTAASAAGPMQAKDKDKKKKARPIPSIPDNLDVVNPTMLKEGGSDGTMSVAKVGNPAGESAVLKTGVTPALESLFAAYNNMAGETYDEKHGGLWGFRSPSVRPLTAAEIAAVQPITGKNKKLYSTRTEVERPADKRLEVDDELQHMAVFAMASGKSRIDDRDSDAEERKAAEGDSAYLTNPTDREEDQDYQRMMGYIAMMDMVTGNTDRLAGSLNTKNWLEDRNTHQVSLIDNDFNHNSGLRHGASGRTFWLNTLMNAAGKGDKIGSGTFMKNIVHGDVGAGEIFGFNPTDRAVHSRQGVDQAVADLPGMRDRLKMQLYQQNGGKPLDEYESELLERMQITHEYMTNPQMAAIYNQLGKIGFEQERELDSKGFATGRLKPEDATITQKRADLLAQRDALRYGGNITAGAKPTATSGPGWTRGTAADWLAAPVSPPQHLPPEALGMPAPSASATEELRRQFGNR